MLSYEGKLLGAYRSGSVKDKGVVLIWPKTFDLSSLCYSIGDVRSCAALKVMGWVSEYKHMFGSCSSVTLSQMIYHQKYKNAE
jgi:hypothetical protein